MQNHPSDRMECRLEHDFEACAPKPSLFEAAIELNTAAAQRARSRTRTSSQPISCHRAGASRPPARTLGPYRAAVQKFVAGARTSGPYRAAVQKNRSFMA